MVQRELPQFLNSDQSLESDQILDSNRILGPNASPDTPPVTARSPRWFWLAALMATLLTGGVFAYSWVQVRSPIVPAPNPSAIPPPPAPVQRVAALGRLEPDGEITRLSAYNSLEGARIDQLLIKEGDTVRSGEVVARLTTRYSRQASLLQAQKQVQVAQAQLQRVRAGSKQGDIAAQQATIARLTAERANAQLEYERNQSLFEAGAISASQRDSRRLALDTIDAQLTQAQASLGSVAEIRPVDVSVAEAEVAKAIAAVKAAETELELTNIRSPLTGQVLKVHVRPGEIVSNAGIAELAKTYQMYAVAEVYETDIEKITLGQPVQVTSNALSGTLRGTVAHIGQQVERQSTFNINPLSETDHKVIAVRVALEPADSKRVQNLTNLQVQLIFQK
jgi:HlyD family secretion protein